MDFLLQVAEKYHSTSTRLSVKIGSNELKFQLAVDCGGTTVGPAVVGAGSKIRKKGSVILLMEEILHHLGCIKPCKLWNIYHINWCSPDFLPSTVVQDLSAYRLSLKWLVAL